MKKTVICLFAFLLFYNIFVPIGNTAYAQNTTQSNSQSVKKGPAAAQKFVNIIVLGDSLTAGYGIDEAYAYPNILQDVLKQFGYPVNIINASVSGSTTAGGATRLRWYLKQDRKISLAIVALGYNDALHNTPINHTTKVMETLLEMLDDKDIPTILMGMKAPANLGKEYAQSFNSLYPKMSTQFNIPLYPFFLEGIALRAKYNLSDRVHPNKKGVKVLVQKTAPIIMSAVFEILNGRKPTKHSANNKKNAKKTRP